MANETDFFRLRVVANFGDGDCGAGEDTATIRGHDLLSRPPGRMLQGIANVALVHRNIILVRVRLHVLKSESCRFSLLRTKQPSQVC